MKKINNITIGSDPECFLYNTEKSKYISSIGLIPGVKGEAAPMNPLGKGFGIQIDNVLAEYNIPPVTSRSEFVSHMVAGKEWIENYMKDTYGEEFIVKYGSSATYDKDELSSKEAQEFGCSVDYNAWTEEPNEKPKGQETNLRTAGTHIHVGYTYEDKKYSVTPCSIELVKAMDLFLGLPSVVLDDDNQRRKLYGKAGAFRLTDYGVEYRVLSGKFIENEKLIGWMYDNTLSAIDFVNEGKKISEDDGIIIQNAINNSDKKAALSILAKYGIKLS